MESTVQRLSPDSPDAGFIPNDHGSYVRFGEHSREVFHLKSRIKKLTEDLEGYKHIAQRDSYYEAFMAWWEGRKD